MSLRQQVRLPRPMQATQGCSAALPAPGPRNTKRTALACSARASGTLPALMGRLPFPAPPGVIGTRALHEVCRQLEPRLIPHLLQDGFLENVFAVPALDHGVDVLLLDVLPCEGQAQATRKLDGEAVIRKPAFRPEDLRCVSLSRTHTLPTSSLHLISECSCNLQVVAKPQLCTRVSLRPSRSPVPTTASHPTLRLGNS